MLCLCTSSFWGSVLWVKMTNYPMDVDLSK